MNLSRSRSRSWLHLRRAGPPQLHPHSPSMGYPSTCAVGHACMGHGDGTWGMGHGGAWGSMGHGAWGMLLVMGRGAVHGACCQQRKNTALRSILLRGPYVFWNIRVCHDTEQWPPILQRVANQLNGKEKRCLLEREQEGKDDQPEERQLGHLHSIVVPWMVATDTTYVGWGLGGGVTGGGVWVVGYGWGYDGTHGGTSGWVWDFFPGRM